MSLAYCILAHKNPAQLARLLRALQAPGNVCVLHYERRAPRAEHEAVARLAREHGAFLLPPRRILWGHFSVVGAQLEALQRALEADPSWTHFITLSGQDFPLIPQAALAAELAASQASYLSCFDPFTTDWWKNLDDRIGRYYFEWPWLEALLNVRYFGRRLRALMGWSQRLPFVPGIRRTVPAWFQYRGGSNHVILSRAAAEYITGDPTARRIIAWLRHSEIPDESLFQTVLFNSPLAGKMVNDDRRAIRWNNLGDPSPVTLTAADLPWLWQQRNEGRLFARKFDAAVSDESDEALRALEKELSLV